LPSPRGTPTRSTLSFWWTAVKSGWRCRIRRGWNTKSARAGITDSLAQEIAGHYLKSALEAGEGLGRDMYSLTIEETLSHLDAVVAEMQAQPA